MHISILSCVHVFSSGSLATAVDIREAVEGRESNDGADDFVDAVEGRADLVDVRPGIASVWSCSLSTVDAH